MQSILICCPIVTTKEQKQRENPSSCVVCTGPCEGETGGAWGGQIAGCSGPGHLDLFLGSLLDSSLGGELGGLGER